MHIRSLLSLSLMIISLAVAFAQVDERKNPITTAYHYRNNITIKNADGTQSNIYTNGSTATLTNEDGTQTILDYSVYPSLLIGNDGAASVVFRNGMSSTVHTENGTELINHGRRTISTSTFSTPFGTHRIMHTFGARNEWCSKRDIDVLVHMNWLMQQKAQTIAMAETYNAQENQK